jgi:hypothetical protein
MSMSVLVLPSLLEALWVAIAGLAPNVLTTQVMVHLVWSSGKCAIRLDRLVCMNRDCASAKHSHLLIGKSVVLVCM